MYKQQLTVVEDIETVAGGATVTYDIVPCIGRPVLSVLVYSATLAVTLRIHQAINDTTGTPTFIPDPYTAAVPAATSYSVVFGLTGKYVRVSIVVGAGVNSALQVYSELRMS